MKQRTALLSTLTILLLLGGGVACRKPKTAIKDEYAGKTAKDLLEMGDLYLQNGHWEEGRKILRTIEERLPSSAEFPKAKLLIADSFFFGSTSTFPEALVEYKSFLNYFPRHERRDYALYRVGLCHYASIENAERDQNETRRALDAFQALMKEAPGSIYAVDAKAKVTQCWRRLAEAELMVGIFYVKSFHFAGAERRIKGLLETYPEYVDRERAYFYLGEALRKRPLDPEVVKQFQKDWLAKIGKDDTARFSKAEGADYAKAFDAMAKGEADKYALEAKGYYKKLVESYPSSEWAARASDRLVEMGQSGLKEELDS